MGSFLDLKVIQLLQCFNSNCPMAIFCLHVSLLLLCKFQLNLPCGLRDVQDRFSRWCLWQSSWISDQHKFGSGSCPLATEQVSAQTDQRYRKRCLKLIFKMVDILNFD